jgi:hypothetical protein
VIKNFSVLSVLRDPSPFIQTSEEALAVKGGGTAAAYGLGGIFKSVGQAFVNAGSPIRGGSYIYTGDALQSLTLAGVKGLGIAGTALTVGATVTDLGVNLNASFGCSDQL